MAASTTQRAGPRRGPGATLAAVPLALCIALVGCGGDGDDPPAPVEDDPQPGTPLEPIADPGGTESPATPLGPADPPASEPADEPENGDQVGVADESDPPTPIDPDDDDVPGLVVEGLGGQAPEDLSTPWLVNTSFRRLDSRTPGTGDAFVALLAYDEPLTLDVYVDFYAPELDACELTRTEGDGAPQTDPFPRASGGASVTINTPAGPWFVLQAEPQGEGGTDIDYSTDDELPGPLPDDATLSIPGDVFPNVAAFALPDEPAVPVRLSPDEDEPLGLDTVYSWVPGNGSDFVEIVFLAFDAVTGDFIDFPIGCRVVDDGSFALPDDARAFLATTTDDVTLRYERSRNTLTLEDGIVFRARTVVAE